MEIEILNWVKGDKTEWNSENKWWGENIWVDKKEIEWGRYYEGG